MTILNLGKVGKPPKGIDEIRALYGDVKIDRDVRGGWRIISPVTWESMNCVLLYDLPGLPNRRLYVHKAIVEPLHAALKLCLERCPQYPIRTIGCFNPRPKRTAGLPPGVVGWNQGLSMHAVAAALDINASSNPMKKPLTTDMPTEFVASWQEIGWKWGGDFSMPDPMHFQWAHGY